jgi:hypothetical protein
VAKTNNWTVTTFGGGGGGDWEDMRVGVLLIFPTLAGVGFYRLYFFRTHQMENLRFVLSLYIIFT